MHAVAAGYRVSIRRFAMNAAFSACPFHRQGAFAARSIIVIVGDEGLPGFSDSVTLSSGMALGVAMWGALEAEDVTGFLSSKD